MFGAIMILMTYGFKQSHFNYASRWKVDCDYFHKLNAAEKEFMARFLKEFYEGKTFPDANLIKDKKESYDRQNASQRCSMIRFHKAPGAIETCTVPPDNHNDIIFKEVVNG